MFPLLILHWGVVNAQFVIRGIDVADGSLGPVGGSAKIPEIVSDSSAGGVRGMGSARRISGTGSIGKVSGRGKLC